MESGVVHLSVGVCITRQLVQLQEPAGIQSHLTLLDYSLYLIKRPLFTSLLGNVQHVSNNNKYKHMVELIWHSSVPIQSVSPISNYFVLEFESTTCLLLGVFIQDHAMDPLSTISMLQVLKGSLGKHFNCSVPFPLHNSTQFCNRIAQSKKFSLVYQFQIAVKCSKLKNMHGHCIISTKYYWYIE